MLSANGSTVIDLNPATGSDGVSDHAGYTVPAEILFHGDYKRAGFDLKITGTDGKAFVVHDYFKAEHAHTLYAPDGAALTGDIVEALAGPLAPGEYAQATAPQGAGEAIGRVATLQGGAVAVRNGVAVTLNVGDVVMKGDVVQTQGNSAVGVIFADGTTFDLGANARMVLNEFVYDPSHTSGNSAVINLVQGSITFIAGQVAHTGDMKVGTPVATMGIRGTAVHVDIDVNLGTTQVSLLFEPSLNRAGSFDMYSLSGQLIANVIDVNGKWSVSPTGPLDAIATESLKTPAEMAQALTAVQVAFNTQQLGQALLNAQPLPGQPSAPQGPQGPQSPPDNNQNNQHPTSNTPKTQIGADESTTKILIEASESNGTPTTTTVSIITPPPGTPPVQPIVFQQNYQPPPPPPAPSTPPTNTPAFFESNSADQSVHVQPVVPQTQKTGVLEFTDSTGDTHTVTVTPHNGDIGTLTASIQQDTSTSTVGDIAYTYTNDTPTQNHTDVFDVTVTDSAGNQTTTTISFVVQNQNPVATDVTAMVTEAQIASHHAGSKFVLPGSLLLSVTDPDNDPLSITSISKPTVTENDPALKVFFVSTETPADGEAGRYEIHTNFGDMHVSVGTNGQVFLWSDHGDDPFAPLGVGETATISFDYTVSDGNGGTDTKTVTLTVDGTNNAPSAHSDFLFVTESQVASATSAAPRFVGNVLFNDHDVDGDAIAVTGVSAVSVSEHDSGLSILGITQQDTSGPNEVARYDIQTNYGDAFLSVNSDGHVHIWSDSGEDPFQPLGVDQSATINFTYSISDGNGGTDTAHVALVVHGTNDAPTAVADAFTTTEGQIESASSSTPQLIGSILGNDSDVDGDHLSVTGITAPSVSGGPAGLQILGVQSESAGSGEVARYDITTNYGDAHIAVGADGNVYMWSDSGEDPFRPMGSNDTATINFNYTVSDGHGGSDGSTVAITVDGTNDPALILGTKTGSVTETGVNSNVAPDKVTGTLTDTDADNAPNTFQAVTNATASANGYGAFTVDASGHWAYVLDNSNAAVQALANGQTLSDNFTILTQDGTAQNITVTIHGPGNVDQQQDVADGSLSGVGATDQITITPSQGGGYDGTSLTDGAVGHSSLDWHFNASISQLAQQAGVTQVYTITDTTKPSASTTLSVSIGGPGSDQFNFSPSTGVHALVNFSTTVDSSGHYLGDSVNLQGFTNASNQPLALTDVLADLTTDSHGNAVVNLGAEGSLTFAHVSQATIQQQAEHIFKFGTATI